MKNIISFDPDEKKLIGGISLVLATRMLGVSLIIPMFSIFATSIPGSSKTLAGVAVGIFGIAQTIMQVPMGRLSDRWGRKQTTILGLWIYLAGTVLSGMATSIYYLIGARIFAGAGAVSGVTMAWLTDGINPGRRNTALSYVGMSIGLSVIVGFTLSSLIAELISIPALFYICGGFIFI
ncbi:MAG TPA: MFS transporter, partial [Spirochaetota bacterium]|nr:MFS transporter [Spirochaetota bacterium]